MKYAMRMIEFHSRMLKKWVEYVEKHTKQEKTVKEEIKGQMNIFELEEK